MDRITPPTSDDTQEVRGNMSGTKGHHFGNEYDSHTLSSPPIVAVGSGNGGTEVVPETSGAGPVDAKPADAGIRGRVDQRTGEVHGSGAGAGGGAGDEQPDHDAAGGAGAQRSAI